jgi:hypothetical protein
MLRTLPNLDVLRHEIRRRVCTHCHWRPPHSEALGPEAVRPCEIQCPVFAHLPRLCRRAALTDPMLRSRRDVLNHLIDELCARSAAGGRCPLASHRDKVIAAILDLVDRS